MSVTDTKDYFEGSRKIKNLRQLPSRFPNAFWVCIGLSAMGIWMNLVGYSTIFAPADIDQELFHAFNNSRFWFYGGIILSCLMLSLLGDKLDGLFKQRLRFLGVFLGCVMCMSTFAFANAFFQNILDPLYLSFASCFVSGVCYNLFVFIFYVRLAETEGIKTAIICIAISLVVEMVLNDIFSAALAESAHVVIGLVMPLLCGVILFFCFRRSTRQNEKPSYLVGGERNYHIMLIFVMSFGSIAVMAAKQIGPTAGLWGTREDWISPLVFNIAALVAISAIFILLTWFTLVRHTEDRVSVRYQLPFLVIIAGCVLLILNEFTLPDKQFSLEAIAVNAVELFTHLLSWTIVISLIKTVKISVYRILGLRGIFFNTLAIAWIVLLEGNNPLVNSVILLVIFVIIMGITALPLNLNRGALVDEDNSLEMIAEKYGLSSREKEIFVLLAQGRNRPYIQRQLFLADGTVKTHSSHIYTKLNIHSRQEMLDLIAKERRHL